MELVPVNCRITLLGLNPGRGMLRRFACFILVIMPHICMGEEDWGAAVAGARFSSNSVWMAQIPGFSKTNATISQMCRHLEAISRQVDKAGRGIHISDTGLSEEQRGRAISVKRGYCKVLDAFLSIIMQASPGVTFRIVDGVAVIGRPEWRAIPVAVFLECIDANTGDVIVDAKVAVEIDSMNPWRQLPLDATVNTSEKGMCWIGRIMIPFVATDTSLALVDSTTWDRVIRFRASATGYDDKVVDIKIFGDLNVTAVHQIKLTRKLVKPSEQGDDAK